MQKTLVFLLLIAVVLCFDTKEPNISEAHPVEVNDMVCGETRKSEKNTTDDSFSLGGVNAPFRWMVSLSDNSN